MYADLGLLGASIGFFARRLVDGFIGSVILTGGRSFRVCMTEMDAAADESFSEDTEE